ncbi:putative hydrolase of the HAD superfamily [Cricetibacter osteomyelitidis]|uniref:Putative hydrolase of the HAD superfamily n=1 Tax=Cricetibacter osteomyelitidis TaxID=1521931 RepID=A0A4R2SMH2_9PAST|nr:HAD-IA family hydrolase [Cricetibacter osteomyelitidis]TCP90155.1 putative hydrolase of the HAD superfamily [Cricetibacter osteomyelitidis]
MKFYRTLQPFKVISFDLDDTLYDNHEVIRLAESNFVEKLKSCTHIAELDSDYWRNWKLKIERQNPLLCEDVTEWRFETLQQLLAFHGKSAMEIAEISQHTMDEFLHWRHQIDLPQQSVEVLNQLKRRFQLAALTNGNVEPMRIGLVQFDLYLRGGKQGRAKPHQDLFHQTAEYFNISPQEILHIGDDLTTDVKGAINAGCQSVWLNLSGNSLVQFREARMLPTVEIGDLAELLAITQHYAHND